MESLSTIRNIKENRDFEKFNPDVALKNNTAEDNSCNTENTHNLLSVNSTNKKDDLPSKSETNIKDNTSTNTHSHNNNKGLKQIIGRKDEGSESVAADGTNEPVKFCDIYASDEIPVISIGSFGCISMDNNSLWEKQTETFDLIARSLPQDHIGMSESTSDIPTAFNLNEFMNAPNLSAKHNGLQSNLSHLHNHRSASDVTRHVADSNSSNSSNIFPISNEDSKIDTNKLTVKSIPNGRQHSAGDLNRKDLSNRKKSGFMKRSAKLESLISLGVSSTTSNVLRSRKPASIFGSAFFVSNNSSNLSSKSNLIITEAQCLVPSMASEYYIDDFGSMENIPDLQRAEPFNLTSKLTPLFKFRPFFKTTISLQEKLDALETSSPEVDSELIDDNDQRNLKRSVSVPPKYEYHEQTHIFKVEPVENSKMKIESPNEKLQEFDEQADILGNLATAGKITSKMATKKGGKWQKTMPDLIEGPESETLTSQSSARILLARTALAIIKGEYDKKSMKSYHTEDDDDEMTETEIELANKLEIKKYKKNLFVISIGFFCIFTAYLSLRNLQSSLNSKSGLGLYALSALYGCFVLGCILATTIVQRLRPKISMIIACLGLFTYDLANMMPCFETMVPASCIVGISLGILWTAHNTYLANMAVGYAELTGSKVQDALSKFNGTFFLFYQSSQIVGGLLSSLVLNLTFTISANSTFLDTFSINNTLTYNDTSLYPLPNFNVFLENSTPIHNHSLNELSILKTINSSDQSFAFKLQLCGSNYCPKKYIPNLDNQTNINEGKTPPSHLVKVLVGFYTGCSILGILVLIFFLDRLEGTVKKPSGTLPRQLIAVFSFYLDRRAICMLGIMFYSLLQSAFMFGEFTKAFVTCIAGVQMVGYVMVSLSASSAVCSYFNGILQKRIGRNILLFTAILLQSSMLLTMMLWNPSEQSWPVIFLIAIIWGLGDGIILTQTISLVGFLFSDNKEPAFAALKMTQSGTNFIFFLTSPYVCTKFKIMALFAILMFASVGYITLDRLLKVKKAIMKNKMLISEVEVQMNGNSEKNKKIKNQEKA